MIHELYTSLFHDFGHITQANKIPYIFYSISIGNTKKMKTALLIQLFKSCNWLVMSNMESEAQSNKGKQ